MSIFFDFEVGDTGRRFRRAVDEDRRDIELFWNCNETEDLFGTVDIGSLIELSTLSICMINEKKEVIGLMSLCDYPNIPGVDPSDWEIWIRNMFQKYYISRSTLFIRFFCCKKEDKNTFLEEALTSVFLNDPYLSQIVLYVAPKVSVEYFETYQTFKKRNFFKHFTKREENNDNSGDCLYVACRPEFCLKLKLRRAVEEDNDDIVEILDKKSPKLKELYGEFYISEIIGRHPESKRKIIVADYQDQVVGVMCLSSEINYEDLQKIYELRPYNGLMTATPLEKEEHNRTNVLLETFGEPIMLGQLSPFDDISRLNVPKSDILKSSDHTTYTDKAKSSRVDFTSQMSLRQNAVNAHESDLTNKDCNMFNLSASSYGLMEYDLHELLDDDPFDYDIVNIDQTLLKVPEALSYDRIAKLNEYETKLKVTSITSQKYRRKNSVINVVRAKIPDANEYKGTPNAMMIELFGLREDIDERESFNLLKAAFEVMVQYDYCIILLPTAEKNFPLLQHFSFVPTKCISSSKMALYVAHRNSVTGKLRVREAEIIDIPEISRMCENLDCKETLWTIENSISHKRDHISYVMMSGLSLVGIAILEPPGNIDYFRGRYNICPYHTHKYHSEGKGVQCGFATVKMILSYSVFEPHFRYFARDIMRLSGASALLWLTGYRNKWVMKKANSLASVMIPLMPLESAIDYAMVPNMNKLNMILRKKISFGTWFISKKVTSIPMVYVTARIVVVGASNTAMGFLNSLLFSDSSSYLLFTSVTLVSPHGLPYTKHSRPIADMMFPTQNKMTDKYLKSIPYTYYVNVVQGTLVDIEKRDKYIVLSNGHKLHYDYLFLMFGKQFQHPDYLEPLLERERDFALGKIPPYIRLDDPRHDAFEKQLRNKIAPENVFILNSIVDAINALKYIESNPWVYSLDSSPKIIVYGSKINAYCCLAALLEFKIPTGKIVFVESFPPESETKTRVPTFCNAYVDCTIQETLENLGIDVYSGYYFDDWQVNIDSVVTRVNFISKFKYVQLECEAFFYYGKRGIDTRAYIAINKSGLVYDNGILIDNKFQTNDTSIYAAGPVTAYRRKYYAQSYKQKYYDSYEIGEKLGSQIRDELDPLFTEEKLPRVKKIGILTKCQGLKSCTRVSTSSQRSISFSEISEMELPVCKKPLVKYCCLPGGLQYLEVRSPGKKIPHHYVQSLQFNGIVMETFKTGYFKVHLNTHMMVDGVTCLAKKQYSIEKFKYIYGLSSVVLNNVYVRYSTKKIDNFYEYFSLPWAYFLYHQQIDELFAMVKELLPKDQSSGESVMEALSSMREKIDDDEAINEIRSKFTKSSHIEAITDYVLEWLSENEVSLPMYLQPTQMLEYHHDLDRNPAFKKKKRSIKRLLSAVF